MLKILFLCTANSCRSIFAEAICNFLSQGQVQAFSAGVMPAGRVHPQTLETLSKQGIEISSLKSKAIDTFSTLSPDIVITVCDRAAKEGCPIWLGQAIEAHWGMADPAQASANDSKQAFEQTFALLYKRIELLLQLPLQTLAPLDLQHRLAEIGKVQLI